MKKSDLMNIGGMTDEIADAVIEAYAGYIPKTRFDDINNANKELKAKIEELNKNSEAFEQLKSEFATANETLKRERTDRAISEALIKAGARNLKAVLPFIDVTGADENGVIKNLDEQIAALKNSEENSFLFVSNQPAMKGVTPVEKTQANTTLTRADFNRMSYAERANLYTNDPALYESITKESE